MSHRNLYSLSIIVILAIGLLAIQSPGQARAAGPWYVATTGSDANDCISPTTPCATINGAIGKAAIGDTINVAVGTYTGTGIEVVLLDRSATLAGGWDAAFITQSGMSTIDGEDARRGVTVASGFATIERFVVQNGFEGGIFTTVNGSLTLNYSTVSNNNSSDGGGIVAVGPTVLNYSTVSDNQASFSGGGIWNLNGTLTLNHSTISNNVGGNGGGIANDGFMTILNNSTVSGNTALGDSGGIYHGSNILILNNSSISGNTASFSGGGLNSQAGGNVTMQNTIISGNTSPFGPDCAGIIGSSGYNLIGDTSNCVFAATTGDVINLDPLIGPLQDNGGPTFTHALLSGSPAIDAGNPAGCMDHNGNLLITDQRGVGRIGICDIGAFEVPTAGLLVTGGDNQSATTTLAFPQPLQATAFDYQGNPVSGVTVTFTAPASGPSGTFAASGTNTTQIVSDENGVATTSTFIANDQAGVYTISASAPGFGSVNFNLEQTSRPQNDDLANAELVTSLPFSDSLDNSASTVEPDESHFCGSTPETRSVWYSFTPATTVVVRADMLGSSFSDANLTLFQSFGTGFGGLSFMNTACFGASLTFTAQAGTTYFFQAESYSSAGGDLHFNLQQIPAPANDNFESAQSITTLPFNSNVEITGATTEPDEPTNCFFMNKTVWYSFTPTETMSIRADMNGSTVTSLMNIYRATADGISNLQHLQCAGFGNSTTFLAEAGEQYYIQAGSLFFGEVGSIQVNLQQIFPPANDYFASAEEITALPFSVTPNMTDTGLEPGEPQVCNFMSKTVWYAFTPTEAMSIRVSVQGHVNIYRATGDGLANLQHVQCGNIDDTSTAFYADANETYYFQVGPRFEGQFVQLNVQQAFPPANDLFVNAEEIPSLPFNTSADLTDAGIEPGEPTAFCFGMIRTVWYSFQPAETMSIRLTVQGPSNVYRATGDGISNLQHVQCGNFDGTPVTFLAEANETYYIQAGSGFFGGLSTQVSLQQVFPPGNDLFANAEEITSLPFSAAPDLTDTGIEPGEPQYCTFVTRTVWYSFTPTETVSIRATTQGFMNIYRATGGGISSLQQMRCISSGASTSFLAEAGQKYYLQLAPLSGGVGTVQIDLQQVFPPANDLFSGAEFITALPFSDTSDIIDTSIETGEPQICYFMERTVWYAFIPDETMVLRANVQGSSLPGNVNVYQAGGPGIFDLQFMTCSGSGGSPSFVAEAGRTYFLQAGPISSGPGSITVNLIQAIPPENDNLANASLIDALPFSAVNNIADASTEPGEPQNCYTMQQTTWFMFTPSETTRLRADTQGSGIYGNVNIYTAQGPNISDLQFLTCSGPFNQSTFTAEADQTYFFQVGAAFGESGSVQLNLGEVPVISGRITDAVTGQPLPGNIEPFGFVSLYRVCGENCLDFVNSQNVDGEGRFQFESYYYGSPLPAGTYEIFASAHLYLLQQFEPIEFVGTSLDVGDIALTPSASIRGRAVSEITGNPLPAAFVTLYRCESEGNCFEFVNSQYTDVNGQFLFNSYYYGAILDDGSYRIEITADLHEVTRVDFSLNDGESLDLGDVVVSPVPLISSIQGRVLDNATGKPIAAAFAPFVNLYRCYGDTCFEFVASQVPDSAGGFRFETNHSGNPLPAGRYKVIAFAEQYQQVETAPFDVGEDVDWSVGSLRLTSLPLRFSDIHSCAEIPSTGSDCVYSVRVWNGGFGTFDGAAWSTVDGILPETFTGNTQFQARERTDLTLGRGQSRVIQFRFTVPANNSTFGTFLCARLFVAQGGNSSFNTVGYRDLFCVLRNAGGFTLASPNEAMSLEQENVTVARTGTDIEPNNSCQSAQEVGDISEPFVLDGNLDYSQGPDIDFFRFTATPGLQATVDHEGQATGRGTLSDPLLGFFDSNCNLIAYNDDTVGLNSRLEITVPQDGVFILAATAYADFSFFGFGGSDGTYQLSITPVETIGSITGRVTDALTGSPLRGDVAPFAFVRLLQCNQSGCFDVNNQMADADGRFSFSTDFNAAPLRVGSYIVIASADQYHGGQTDTFTVGNDEDHDVGDIALTSYPVRFTDIQPCVVPAAGGVCEFSVRITNGLATQLTGKAWNMIVGLGTGSFTNFTVFQDNPLQNVRLDPGQSTVLRFQLRVRESVADGATICATLYVGEGQSPYFNPVGASTLFCVTKGSAGFTMLTDQQTHRQIQEMHVQEIISPSAPAEIKK